MSDVTAEKKQPANFNTKIDGNKLIIEVDLTQVHGQTAKMNVCASSAGSRRVGDALVNLNVWTKRS